MGRPIGFPAIGNEGGNPEPEGRQRKGAEDVGSSGGLVTEVDSEANQYRHQADYIAEMLATLGRLQRLVQHSQRRTSSEAKATSHPYRLLGSRRRVGCPDRSIGNGTSKFFSVGVRFRPTRAIQSWAS